MERVWHEEAPLREVWVAPIAQLFIDGEWDESDIVKTHVGRDGAKVVWNKILDACLKKVGEISDIQRPRLYDPCSPFRRFTRARGGDCSFSHAVTRER